MTNINPAPILRDAIKVYADFVQGIDPDPNAMKRVYDALIALPSDALDADMTDIAESLKELIEDQVF